MRRIVSAVTMAAALLILATAPAWASVDPPPAPAPSGPDLGGLGQSIATSLLSGWQAWLDDYLGGTGPAVVGRAFLKGLGWIGQRLLQNMGDASRAAGEDVITTLSGAITVDDPTVRGVYDTARGMLTAVVGIGATYLGFRALVSFGSVTWGDVGLFLPRAVVAVVGANMARDLMAGGLAASNAVGSHLAGQGAGNFSRLVAEQANSETAGGMILVMAAAVALLFVQRILMHGVLDLLTMLAPLAIAAWAVPAWGGRFWQWAGVLLNILLANALQVMALAAGASMMGRALANAGGSESRSLLAALIATGFLFLAISLPALLGLGMVGGSLIGHVRSAAMTAHVMRTKVRTPRPQAPAPQKGTSTSGEAEFDDSGWDYDYGGEMSGGRTIDPKQITVYRIPSLPAQTKDGGATRRLPPPDYTKE